MPLGDHPRRPLPARRLAAQTVVITAVLALLAPLALVPDAETVWMPRLSPVADADVTTPDQRMGSADGLPHTVDTGMTSAEGGGGGKVEPPEGALPREWPDVPEEASVEPPETGPRPMEEPEAPEVEGFDPDTSEEIPEERDEFSRTYRNADGTLATDFSLEPLHFENDKGDWEEIDPTLIPERTGVWSNRADANDVDFSETADGAPLARMETEDGRSVAFSAEGTGNARGEVSEDDPDTIVYEDALDGAGIELTALRGGAVKETIVLDEAPQAPEDAVWRFPLDLDGLDPRKADDGGIDLVDPESGDPEGHIPAGYMSDSDIDPRSGDGAESDDVHFELVEEGGSWTLEVTADFDWLTSGDRVYPVRVDPTAAWNYNASQDTYVQSGYGSSRYQDKDLKAGTYNGGSTKAASYLRFSSMVKELEHHKIYNAELYLFNHWSYSCTAKPVTVHEVTGSWDQKKIAGYPGPKYDSTPLGRKSFAHGWMPAGASSSSCPAAYEGIDLGSRGRDLVQDWVDGDKPNRGLTVRASTSDSYGWKKFGSRESWGAPYMTVVYSPYRADYAFAQNPPEADPAPTANRATYVDVKVTNRGKETWTPSNGYELSYALYGPDGERVYHEAPTTEMPENVTTGETVTVKAKVGPLPPGEWTVKFDMTHKAQSFAAWGVPRTAQLTLDIPDLPPQLVDYSPRDGATVATLRPEFTAVGRNNDAWPDDGLEFWFVFCDGAWPDWECTDSGWQEDTSWKLPDGLMEWGGRYSWTVWVRDGSQTTEGPWLSVGAEPDQPAVTSKLAAGGTAESEGGVDPLLGNFTRADTDAAVPTPGPPLTVTRTFNSADPRQGGMFGSGWSTRFDMRLLTDADGTGNAVVTYPDGRQYRFARNGDGSYTAPKGMFATLRVTDGGGWRLMDKQGDSYVFDADGALVEITDHRGRKQTLDHSGGRLSTVTGAGGRLLRFAWDDGHVSSVTAEGPDGTSAEWAYIYEGDRLTSVCDPEGGCTSYAYEDGSHYRAAVLDANPYGYWRFDEGEGTTSADEIHEALGGEPAQTAEGALGAEHPLAGTTGGSLDAGVGHASLPDSLLQRVGTRITVETWISTTGHGTVLGAMDAEEDPAQRAPLLYVGTDGKLRGGFWNSGGAGSSITSSEAVNDGGWHHVALTSDGTVQRLYIDGEEVGSREGQVDHRAMKFLYAGRGVADSGWPATRDTKGEFPFDGRIDEVAVYQRPLHPETVRMHAESGQDPADRLVSALSPEERVQDTVSYDESTSRVERHVDADGGEWLYGDRVYRGDVGAEEPEATAEVTVTDPRGGTTVSTYDALEGHRIVRTEDQLGYTTTYAYDVGGFLAEVTDPNGAVTEFYNDERGNRLGRKTCRDTARENCFADWFHYFHNADDPFDPRNDQLTSYHDPRSQDFLDETYRTWWAYNEYGEQQSESGPPTEDFPSGRERHFSYTHGTEPAVGGGTLPAGLLASETDPNGGTTRYSYTAAGDRAEVVEPNGLTRTFTYDGLGRVLSETVSDGPEGQSATTSYTYDDAGRVLTETAPTVENEVTGASHTARTTYTYDADGNRLTAETADLGEGAGTRVETWEYDAHGREKTHTGPEGAVTHTGYDATGAVVTRIDAEGTQFQTAYTLRGEVAEEKIIGWTGHPDMPIEATTLVLESRAYDPAGRLASVTDAVGRTTAYDYYADGLLARVTAQGAVLNDESEPRDVVREEFEYDGAGNTVAHTSEGGERRTVSTYDAASFLTEEVLDPDGLARTTSYSYDGNGNVLSETLTAAGTERVEEVRYAYDAGDHLVSETVENGDQDLVTRYTVDTFGRVVREVDPRGAEEGASAADHATDMRYDARGDLVEVRGPEVDIESEGGTAERGRPTTLYGYDAFGDRTHEVDAEGGTTVTEYDRAGRVIAQTAPEYTGPDGAAIAPRATVAYDDLGRKTEQTDALGATRSYSYDQLGNLAVVTDPPTEDGAEAGRWVMLSMPTGETAAVSDPSGALTEATYDDLGRQVTETRVERLPQAGAYTTEYAYDAGGRVVSVTDPLGNTRTSEYNAAGELVESTDETGAVTRFEYDLAGRAVKAETPEGTVHTSAFDLAGRMTENATAGTGTDERTSVSFAYDAAGNAVAETDALGETVRRAFDAGGRMVELVEPVADGETITTSFGYDAMGHRTRTTDGRGNSVITGYNAVGLVESLTEPATEATPDEADRTWRTFYDAGGNPVREEAPGGAVRTREFDALGRLVAESGTGAEAMTANRTLGYDAAGRLNRISTALGEVEAVYDDRGNLAQILGPETDGTGEPVPSVTMAYDAAGRLESRTDKETGTATFERDAGGRVVSQYDPVTRATVATSYDDAGRPVSVSTDGGAARELTYDGLGRLASDAVAGGPSVAYTYDAAGRTVGRTTSGTVGAGTESFSYDGAGRLASWTGPSGEVTEYEWDASGNRVRAGDVEFEYDERNRLTSSSAGDRWEYTPRGTLAESVVSGVARTPQFDAFERMTSAGDGNVSYGYDALGRVVSRTQDDGVLAAEQRSEFTYTGWENDPITVTGAGGDVLSAYGRDEDGALLSIADGEGEPGLAFGNSHSDLVAAFTSEGDVLGSASYDPFGEVVESQGQGASVGYQGEWTDPATGDVNMHARWYQPGTGRFASRDTMTLNPDPSVQANRYTYGNGDPVANTDPTGHCVLSLRCWRPVVPGLGGGGYGGGGTVSTPGWLRNGWSNTKRNAAIGWTAVGAGAAWVTGKVTGSRSRAHTRSRGGTRARSGTRSATTTFVNWPSVGVGAATGRFSTGTHWRPAGRGGWYPRKGWSSGGGRGGAPSRPAPPKVDPRKAILAKILDTPQPRPAINNPIGQEEVDESRRKAERRTSVEEVDFDVDDYETFEDAVVGLEDKLGGINIESADEGVRCESRIQYSPINARGQRGAALGAFCGKEDLNPNRFDPKVKPPAFQAGDNASHLIASLFYGQGVPENIISMTGRANKSGMKRIESRVARHLQGDHRVLYLVTPVYEGDGARPWGVHMQGIADNGDRWDACVINGGSFGYVDGDVCREKVGS
ncbi:DNRLRE domain-containing protein [Nocardiopsis suaedae]|uniref:DNRLRE domain-containing protein n=1 Tax=Nocardiopsis suaedae TaxID=3018444 RepID=A0ABT4TJ48_9ACTN|nr:DNRLRE domain-containing protein [Nocardiopsis suaedae]MDA2804396.1 DNRLRE domain-containing protein [Nocardiopsis suaedae]